LLESLRGTIQTLPHIAGGPRSHATAVGLHCSQTLFIRVLEALEIKNYEHWGDVAGNTSSSVSDSVLAFES